MNLNPCDRIFKKIDQSQSVNIDIEKTPEEEQAELEYLRRVRGNV